MLKEKIIAEDQDLKRNKEQIDSFAKMLKLFASYSEDHRLSEDDIDMALNLFKNFSTMDKNEFELQLKEIAYGLCGTYSVDKEDILIS